MFLDQAETFGANGKNGEPVGATIRVFQSQDFILSKLVCKLLGFNTNMWVGIWGS